MDGNQRYSWTKKKRSPLVSRTLPRLFRCNTISCCRSVAISASSRAFDLNGETKMARTNRRSLITRSAYAIRSPSQRDEVFGTHRAQSGISAVYNKAAYRDAKRYDGLSTGLKSSSTRPSWPDSVLKEIADDARSSSGAA